MKKPVLRSPLDRLPLHVKQQLAAWLTTGGPHGQGITYAAARAKLLTQHGVRASADALSHFFRRIHRRPEAPVASTPLLTISVSVHRRPVVCCVFDHAATRRLRSDPDFDNIIIAPVKPRKDRP